MTPLNQFFAIFALFWVQAHMQSTPPSQSIDFYSGISIRQWPTYESVERMRHGKWFILKKNRGLFHVEKVVKKRKTRFHRRGQTSTRIL